MVTRRSYQPEHGAAPVNTKKKVLLHMTRDRCGNVNKPRNHGSSTTDFGIQKITPAALNLPEEAVGAIDRVRGFALFPAVLCTKSTSGSSEALVATTRVSRVSPYVQADGESDSARGS